MSENEDRSHEWITTPDGKIGARYAGHAILRRRTRRALERLILAAAKSAKTAEKAEKRRRIEAMLGEDNR